MGALMSPFLSFVIIILIALVSFVFYRFVGDADKWVHFLGACVIWAALMIASARWSGLFKPDERQPAVDVRVRAFFALTTVTLVPLIAMFLLLYWDYVPRQKMIVYGLCAAILTPIAQRSMWLLRGSHAKPKERYKGGSRGKEQREE